MFRGNRKEELFHSVCTLERYTVGQDGHNKLEVTLEMLRVSEVEGETLKHIPAAHPSCERPAAAAPPGLPASIPSILRPPAPAAGAALCCCCFCNCCCCCSMLLWLHSCCLLFLQQQVLLDTSRRQDCLVYVTYLCIVFLKIRRMQTGAA